MGETPRIGDAERGFVLQGGRGFEKARRLDILVNRMQGAEHARRCVVVDRH